MTVSPSETRPPNRPPPAGRVTILFTDVEDSARMAAALGDRYRAMNDEHFRRLRAAIDRHGGYEDLTAGDSFLVLFDRADDALACAVAMQQALAEPGITEVDRDGTPWTLRVRIGIHSSDVEIDPRTDAKTGRPHYRSLPDVNFAARVMGPAAGGQILVSEAAHRAAGSGERYSWKDWPNRRLKSFDQPKTVWELMWDGKPRGEPGKRWLPAWFFGESNRYIPRPVLEALLLSQFATRPVGRMPRLVTIHGFGGRGKTRLAVECALQAVGLFDGVYFVPLHDRLPKVEALTEAIGAAFGWSGPAALPDAVLAALRERNVLVVLDNFETVDCDEVQRYIGRLVTETSHLRLLVTGREPVKLDDAEHLVNLDDPRNHMTADEARDLFIERVRLKLGPKWTPSTEDEVAIAQILTLTEHLPLALELAAAWSKLKTLAEISAGIAEVPLGSVMARRTGPRCRCGEE
jgi:class 3 adenylate cyclase